MKGLTLIFVAIIIASAAFRCGSSGDDSASTPSPEPSGSVIVPPVRDVSGSFYLGTTTTPAIGFELWIADHTAGNVDRIPLSDSGKFSLAIARFTESHVYSLHVVKNFVLYGDVDFDAVTPGTQGAFLYAGGYGFSVGDVVLALDDHGVLTPGTNRLAGSLGGGFTLTDEVNGSLNDYPVPEGVASVGVGSQLVVLDPVILLHSFYRSAANPRLFARDLAAFSRIGMRIEGKDASAVVRANLSEAGNWMSSARLATTDDTALEAAPFWSKSNYVFNKLSDTLYTANVYQGSVPDTGSMVSIKVTPEQGPQTFVWRAMGGVLSHPPSLHAVDASGNAVQTVDYVVDSGQNGLTKAFCQTGDVTLVVSPPLGPDGNIIADGTFDRVDVEFDYYATASARIIRITPSADQYATPYSRDLSGSTDDGLAWTWTPATNRVSFALDITAQAASTHVLELDSKIFPVSFGDMGVVKVRTRIYYRSSLDATEGGVAAWFDNHCS